MKDPSGEMRFKVEGYAICHDIKTMDEGWLRVRLYLVTALLMILSGGIMLVRELLFNVDLNVEDADWRDQLYDYRVTQPGIAYHHEHFRTASWSLVANGTLADARSSSQYLPVLLAVSSAGTHTLGAEVPAECALCDALDQKWAAAMGLSPENATIAGRARLVKISGVDYLATSPGAAQEYQFTPLPLPFVEVWWKGQLRQTYSATTQEAVDSIGQLVANVTAAYPMSADYSPPYPYGSLAEVLSVRSERGGPAVRGCSGAPWERVALSRVTTVARARKSFGWWRDFWPWSGSCPNTAYRSYTLQGSVTVELGAYDPAGGAVGHVAVEALGQVLFVPTYESVADYDSSTATIRTITAVDAVVSFSQLRGEKKEWRLVDTVGVYGETWTGSLADAAATFTARSASIAVRLQDLSRPDPPRLPLYAGQVYVYAATFLGCGGVLMYFAVPYLWYRMYIYYHLNNNLPPPFYQALLEFRGW